MNIKQKMRIKSRQINIDTFSNKFFFVVNRFFVLVSSIQGNNTKRFETERYYLSKSTIKNRNIIINGKTFMTKQLILI